MILFLNQKNNTALFFFKDLYIFATRLSVCPEACFYQPITNSATIFTSVITGYLVSSGFLEMVLRFGLKAVWCLDSSAADCILTQHSAADKLPWHPGFVCNISTDRIMTAMMDGVTGAQQRSLEREARWRWGRSGQRRRSAHALSEKEDSEWLIAMQWRHLGAGASPKDLRMTGAKWGRKFISCTYVLGLICHLLADWFLFSPYSPTDLAVWPGDRGGKLCFSHLCTPAGVFFSFNRLGLLNDMRLYWAKRPRFFFLPSLLQGVTLRPDV